MSTSNASPTIEPASGSLTLAENPSATNQAERHGGATPFQLRSVIFPGTVLAAVVGSAGIALNRRVPASVPTQEIQRQRNLSELQTRAHTRLTKAAYDPHSTPEMRATALAIRERVDTLAALDARLGTNETAIFLEQENDRWERLIRAPDVADDPRRALTLYEQKESIDSRWSEMVDNGRNTQEMRADERAAEAEIDALFGVDARLGTHEVNGFLRQEIGRSQRVLDAKASNAATH